MNNVTYYIINSNNINKKQYEVCIQSGLFPCNLLNCLHLYVLPLYFLLCIQLPQVYLQKLEIHISQLFINYIRLITYTLSHTNIYTHVYIHTLSHTNIYTHVYIHTLSHTNIYTHVYIHTSFRIQTYTHTYIYKLYHFILHIMIFIVNSLYIISILL